MASNGNGAIKLLRRQTSMSHGDLDQIIVWDKQEHLGDLQKFVDAPPLRSVLIEFHPDIAEQVLKVCNSRNRPLLNKSAWRLGKQMTGGEFELTGDTIKFSKSGVLLDGQHRLQAAVRQKRALLTHVVFGLDDSVFDVLDQGKKRTPSDVLALCGIADHTQVAGAIRWAAALKLGKASNDIELTIRDIRKLAQGEMADIVDYVAYGRTINAGFKHSPSFITALTYVIGLRSKALAKAFIHEWTAGARIGRNENFDTLAQRLNVVARQSGGRVSNTVRAAMVIQMFNAWHAGEVISGRGLTWNKNWSFPKLAFSKKEYAAVQDLRPERVKEKIIGQLTDSEREILAEMSG